jgi:hypothetical protein
MLHTVFSLALSQDNAGIMDIMKLTYRFYTAAATSAAQILGLLCGVARAAA